MSVDTGWLNNEQYDKAETQFFNSVIDKANGELVMNALALDAAWDAAFEAGVLASEAGLGRYSD